MEHPEPLSRLVHLVSSQVRWRRAEHYGLRGAFYGSLASLVPLVFKEPLAPWGAVSAAALIVLGTVAGAVYGLLQRVPVRDAARLVDRAFGLQDRVATAVEWAGRPDRSPLVDALVADAETRVKAVEPRQIVRRVVPQDGRWAPVPLVAALALALSPAVPMPSKFLPDFLGSTDQDEEQVRADAPLMDDARRAVARDTLRAPSFQERDLTPRAGTGGSAVAGDLSAIFKDTSLANQRPDFNSFLKKGDDRLKMLGQADRLPDLQSDFTTSQYKMVFQKSRSLTGGLRPDQISPEKLRELLQEMERLGRKDGNWGSDAFEGMEALEGGHQDRALEAMEKALNKMRAMEEAQRSGKGLRGGRDSDRTGRGQERGRGGEGMGPEDQDFGEGEGLMPGKGRSSSPKGEASQRLRANPYDVGVEGESRKGRKDAYDTNMSGRAGPMPSRLQYFGVIGQYRKMMEDSIAREQIPRDYHTQIKDYFQALDER
jgi:hypothetical protein